MSILYFLGKPRLSSPPSSHASAWRTQPTWWAAWCWYPSPWTSPATSSSSSTTSLTVCLTSVCPAASSSQFLSPSKDTRFPIILLASSWWRFFLQCVSLATRYNHRNARVGHSCLLLCYVLPVTGLAIVLNIPKVTFIMRVDFGKDFLLMNEIFVQSNALNLPQVT